jgi:YbbR domain-containing protein
MGDFLHRVLFHNIGLKLLSLGLAVGLWYAVASDTPAELAVNVPIEFHNVPNNLEINSERIPEAQVRVRGASRLIHQFRATDVHVEVDLANATPGERTVDLTARQVRQPRDLDVVQVVPGQFQLSLDTRATRTVEVRPRVIGKFASGIRIGSVLANPSTVTITGPKSRVDAIEAASTDPVDASGDVNSQVFSTNVYVADPLIQVVHPVPIHVTVMMERTPAPADAH